MAELNGLTLFNDANLVAYYRYEGNSNDSKSTNNGTDTSMTYGAGVYSQGAIFNGTTSFISVGGLTLTGAVSFAVWLKITAYPASGISDIITGATNSSQFYLDTSGKLNFAKNSVLTIGTSTVAVGTGGWHHCVVTYDGTTFTFYIDGVIQGTGSNAQSFNVAARWFGNDGSGGSFYNGAMDDFAIFTKALSQAEVLKLSQNPGGSFIFNLI